MDDATYEHQKARLQTLIRKWHRPLGLDAWRLTYEYDRTGEDIASDHVREGYTVLAHTDCNWPYRRARITFNVAAVAEIDEDQEEDLEEQVVHELVHVVVAELADDDNREDAHHHLERVVVDLARAFVRVDQRWAVSITTNLKGANDAAATGAGGGRPEPGRSEDRAGAPPATEFGRTHSGDAYPSSGA